MLNFRFALTPFQKPRSVDSYLLRKSTMRKLGSLSSSLIAAISLFSTATVAPAFADMPKEIIPVPVKSGSINLNKIITLDGSLIDVHYLPNGNVASATATTAQGSHLSITFQYGTGSNGFTLSGDQLAPVTVSVTNTAFWNSALQATSASRTIKVVMLSVNHTLPNQISPVLVTVSDSSKGAEHEQFVDQTSLLKYASQPIDDAFPGYDSAADYFQPVLSSWWLTGMHDLGFFGGSGLCGEPPVPSGQRIPLCAAFATEATYVGVFSGIGSSCQPTTPYVPGECNTRPVMR